MSQLLRFWLLPADIGLRRYRRVLNAICVRARHDGKLGPRDRPQWVRDGDARVMQVIGHTCLTRPWVYIPSWGLRAGELSNNQSRPRVMTTWKTKPSQNKQKQYDPKAWHGVICFPNFTKEQWYQPAGRQLLKSRHCLRHVGRLRQPTCSVFEEPKYRYFPGGPKWEI